MKVSVNLFKWQLRFLPSKVTLVLHVKVLVIAIKKIVVTFRRRHTHKRLEITCYEGSQRFGRRGVCGGGRGGGGMGWGSVATS